MEGLQEKILDLEFKPNSDYIDEYEKNGYVIIENAFPSQIISEAKIQASPFGAFPDYPVVLNIHSKVWMFGAIMLNKSLLTLMSKIHDGDVCGLNSQYLFKRPNTKYGRQSWQPHQDNAYPKAPHGHYTIVHLAIDPSSPVNGGLTFWRGSHVEPVLAYDYKQSWMEDADADGVTRPGWKIIDIPDKYPLVNVDLKPGSICIMHGHLIHSSTPNMSSELSREQYSMGYCKLGSSFFSGVTSKKRVFTYKELNDVPLVPTEYEISGN